MSMEMMKKVLVGAIGVAIYSFSGSLKLLVTPPLQISGNAFRPKPLLVAGLIPT
jgi:hypothetical protein